MLKSIRSNWLETLETILIPDNAAIPALVGQIRSLSTNYRLSETNKAESLWLDQRMIQAYLAYYFPLNWLRGSAVLEEAQRLGFFEGITNIFEVGSGPGTFHFAALESNLKNIRWSFHDAREAMAVHQRLLDALPTAKENTPNGAAAWSSQSLKDIESNSAVVLSYTLNEMAELPAPALKAEAIVIIEPSTRDTTRALQALRAKLIEKGFHAWAPCTHDHGCPLLLHSPNDWCHSRVHVEVPKWMKVIEDRIPVRNDTLTYSYLLMRKLAPKRKATTARIIGDTLFERGKVRQAVCRGEDREFLSWLTRHGEPDQLARGITIELPENIEKKGNELRVAPDYKF